MLKVLLKYGAEINSSNEYGESALAFAFRDVYARSSLPAYIEETDLSDEDKQKIQELDKKEEQRVKEVFDLLFKNPPTESWASEVASGAVIYALQSGNKEKIELVRKHKLKVSFETKAAHEALLYLAMYNGSNSLKLFKELLDGGVNVNYKDATGQTALFPAVYKNNYEAVKILLEHGIDTAATDNEGKDAWKPCLRDTTIQDACQLHPLGQKYLQQHKEMNEKSPNLLMPIPHDENKPQML